MYKWLFVRRWTVRQLNTASESPWPPTLTRVLAVHDVGIGLVKLVKSRLALEWTSHEWNVNTARPWKEGIIHVSDRSMSE